MFIALNAKTENSGHFSTLSNINSKTNSNHLYWDFNILKKHNMNGIFSNIPYIKYFISEIYIASWICNFSLKARSVTKLWYADWEMIEKKQSFNSYERSIFLWPCLENCIQSLPSLVYSSFVVEEKECFD